MKEHQKQPKSTKKPFIYTVISLVVLLVIGAGGTLVYKGLNLSTSRITHQTSTQPISSGTTNTTATTQTSVEFALQKISDEIISGKISGSDTEKVTIEAFHDYYADTSSTSQSGGVNQVEWGRIHNELLSADRYAKNKNTALLQASWQTIQSDLFSIQGP